MSEGASVNILAIPKSDPDPEPSTTAVADNTRATGLRNFLKGEVIILDDDSDENVDDDELIGVSFVTVPEQIASPISLQENPPKAPRDVAMVHPSRLRHIGATTALGPSSPAPARSYDRPNNNTKTPESDVVAWIARSPPRAPKAMTPQVGNLQAPPTGPKAQTTPKSAAKGVNQMPLGIKSPPTGPKAQTTPRRSSKGTNSLSAGSPARSNPRGKSKRKKFIPLRVKLGGSASPTSVKKNYRPSDLRGLKSPPLKLHVHESIPDIPVVGHIAPTDRQTPNGKTSPHPSSFRPSPKRARESFSSQPGGSRPGVTAVNTHKAPLKVGYGAKRLTKGSNSVPLGIHRREKNGSDRALMPPPADTSSVTREQGTFSQKPINYRGIPTGPRFPEGSSRMTNEVDISREQGYNSNLSPRQPPSTKYIQSPPKQFSTYNPSKRDQSWNTETMPSYQDGNVGARAGEISPSNKNRIMSEKMGYKSGIPHGKSGEEYPRQVSAIMNPGRGGLGMEPIRVCLGMNHRDILREEDKRHRIGALPRGKLSVGRFQARKKSYRNGTSTARGAPPVGARGRGRLMMRKIGHQDRATLGAGRISASANSVFKRSNRGIGTSNGTRMPDLTHSGEMRWKSEDQAKQWGGGGGGGGGGSSGDNSCRDTESLCIVIDSDDDKKVDIRLLQEKEKWRERGREHEGHEEQGQKNQEMQESQKIQKMQKPQRVQGVYKQEDTEMRDKPQVITIDDDVEDEVEEVEEYLEGEVDDGEFDDGAGEEVDGEDEDMEMGETFDGAVDRLCHDLAEIDQASSQINLQIPNLNAGVQQGGDMGSIDEKGSSEGREKVPGESSDAKKGRWKLPPYQHSPGRPTVPMQLFEFVIIERLEQVALSDIFYSIHALEEEKDISHKVSVTAFNDILVRSYLKVRDMMMRDPLLDIDQEACESIVEGELDALLARLEEGGDGGGEESGRITIQSV